MHARAHTAKDISHDIHSPDDASKHNVLAIEMRRRFEGDEKLGSIGVWALRVWLCMQARYQISTRKIYSMPQTIKHSWPSLACLETYRVGHRKHVGLVMFSNEVFVLEFVAINTFSTRAIAFGKVATLMCKYTRTKSMRESENRN